MKNKQVLLTCMSDMLNKASNNRTDRKDYDHGITKNLDSLAKIFYKVGSAGSYISVIYSDCEKQKNVVDTNTTNSWSNVAAQKKLIQVNYY